MVKLPLSLRYFNPLFGSFKPLCLYILYHLELYLHTLLLFVLALELCEKVLFQLSYEFLAKFSHDELLFQFYLVLD